MQSSSSCLFAPVSSPSPPQAPTMTVDDVLSLLFLTHPPPAVALSAHTINHNGNTNANNTVGGSDARWCRAADSDYFSEGCGFSFSSPPPANPTTIPTAAAAAVADALGAYAVRIAALAHGRCGLTVGPTTVAEAAVRTFVFNGGSTAQSTSTSTSTSTSSSLSLFPPSAASPSTFNTKSGDENAKGEACGFGPAMAALRLRCEDVMACRMAGRRKGGAVTIAGGDCIDSIVISGGGYSKRSRLETSGISGDGGSGGGGGGSGSRGRSLVQSATAFLTRPHSTDAGANSNNEGGDADGADAGVMHGDDPTSPRRQHAPPPPDASTNGANTANSSGISGAASSSSSAAAAAASGGGGGKGRDGTTASAPMLVDSSSSSAQLSATSQGSNHNNYQNNDDDASAAEEEADLSPSDRLWATALHGVLPTHITGNSGSNRHSAAEQEEELRRRLRHLRYESALSAETLYSIIQTQFFLVPGADIFLSPVPPNTIMEYNDVRSDAYINVIFAPFSLRDVIAAVHDSRRNYHRNSNSHVGSGSGSSGGHHSNNHHHHLPPLSVAAADLSSAQPALGDSLPLSLSGSDGRALTIADLERCVWRIAANCAVFNAPESLYPQAGRTFAIGCTEVLVRHCREELRHRFS